MESPAGEATAVSEASDLVRDVFANLEKTLKVRRLYEPGHKLRREAVESLVSKFDQAFAVLDQMVVEVHSDALRYEEREVMREERRESSVAFRLFRDGIRSLAFAPEITASEVRRFLEILETNPESPGHFDEDMATLLWHGDFRHIEYVAIDEIGGDGGGDGVDAAVLGPMADMNQRIDRLVGAITTAEAPVFENQTGGVRAVADRRDVFELERRSFAGDGEASAEESVLAVGDDVLARLRAEVEADDVGRLVHRTVDILFDLFREDECELSLGDVQELLRQFLLIGLGDGDLPALNAMLDRLVRHRASGSAVEQLVGGLLDGLASEEAMERLRTAVVRGHEGGPEALLKLLMRLPAAALAPAARHAQELPPGPSRDVYHRVLRSRGRDSPEALVLWLRDGMADEVLEAFSAFLETCNADGLAFVVSELLGHEDPRVRIEAVRAVEQVAEEQRAGLLARAIGDPRSRVRQAALRVLEDVREHRLLGTLLSMVEAGEGDEDEQVRLIHAVAVLGGMAAMACLREHLGARKMSLFMGKKAVAFRRRAILSLRDVKDEAVRAFLAEGEKSRDRSFADACRSVRAITRAEEGRTR